VGREEADFASDCIAKPGGKEPSLLQAHIRRRQVLKTKEFQDEYKRYFLAKPVEEND
jgi:hypothetical protein